MPSRSLLRFEVDDPVSLGGAHERMLVPWGWALARRSARRPRHLSADVHGADPGPIGFAERGRSRGRGRSESMPAQTLRGVDVPAVAQRQPWRVAHTSAALAGVGLAAIAPPGSAAADVDAGAVACGDDRGSGGRSTTKGGPLVGGKGARATPPQRARGLPGGALVALTHREPGTPHSGGSQRGDVAPSSTSRRGEAAPRQVETRASSGLGRVPW